MSIQFKSWRSYWTFADLARNKRRFIANKEKEQFFSAILASSKSREEEIPKNAIFWRAQRGCEWQPIMQDGEQIAEAEYPYDKGRMKPIRDSAREGRANPQGIPYLYLSSEKDTAMSEVRPWTGSHVSVGMFTTAHKLTVINCTNVKSGITYFPNEPTPEKREENVWKDINKAFSRPTTLTETEANYVPTQIIAELFKDAGYDGVAYKSSLGSGYNITLFDLDSATCTQRQVFTVKKVAYEFSEASNPV